MKVNPSPYTSLDKDGLIDWTRMGKVIAPALVHQHDSLSLVKEPSSNLVGPLLAY